MRLVVDLGDPLARSFSGSAFTLYRSAGTKSAASHNNELAYLRALFSELRRLMRGGNLLVLQRLLGHGNITLTQR